MLALLFFFRNMIWKYQTCAEAAYDAGKAGSLELLAVLNGRIWKPPECGYPSIDFD